MNHVIPSILKVEKHYKGSLEIQALETKIIVIIEDDFEFKVVEDEIFLEEHLVWSNGKYAKIIS